MNKGFSGVKLLSKVRVQSSITNYFVKAKESPAPPEVVEVDDGESEAVTDEEGADTLDIDTSKDESIETDVSKAILELFDTLEVEGGLKVAESLGDSHDLSVAAVLVLPPLRKCSN